MMAAELLILNASVLTQDAHNLRAEAVAISGGIISHVGRSVDVAREKGATTRVIDAGGATVLPGFIESHAHLFYGAAELAMLSVEGVRGADRLREAVRRHAAANPGDGLIIGNQMSYVALGEGMAITRHDLDAMLAERPLLLYAPDHHTAWANTKALQMAGILSGFTAPHGSEVVRGPDGMAAGELREGGAINPVAALARNFTRARLGITSGGEPESYPEPADFEADLAVLRQGLAHVARLGITSIHNMDGNLYTLELLHALEARGELTARVRVPFHFKPHMPLAALQRACAMRSTFNGPMVASGFVKMFMDGVLDSGTALMLDDYPDAPGWRGEPLFPQAQFNAVATAADALGLQIAVHAIGDGAVRSVLDGYEAAQQANGRRNSRHRIEHIEVCHEDDFARMARLGVVASMQPPHVAGMAGLPLEPTISKIGRAKWAQAFAWNKVRAAGVPLVFGTDWPIADASPLRSIAAAMGRKAWDAGVPDQRQSLAQVLDSYTATAAYAEFAEATKGRLVPGMLADAVVLDRNIEGLPPDILEAVQVRHTISAGRIVHSA